MTNTGHVADFIVDLPAATSPKELITATATDPFGNTSEFSQFVIAEAVSIQSLQSDILSAVGTGQIDSKGVASSLLSKLNGVESAMEQGNAKTALNRLNAFENHLKAQSGKHIDRDFADLLVVDVQLLREAIEESDIAARDEEESLDSTLVDEVLAGF